MDKILINDVLLNIEGYEEEKGEKGDLKRLSFGFSVGKKNDYHLLENLFNGDLKVVIPETGEEFFARSTSYISQYNGNGEWTEGTLVNVRHTLTVVGENEIESDPNPELSFAKRIASETIGTSLRLTALIELLVEKGIVTEEEIRQKDYSVHERNATELIEKIVGQKIDE